MLNFCDLAVPGVRELQPYQPGKPIEELQREYGLREVIKLASNENPLGPSAKALGCCRCSSRFDLADRLSPLIIFRNLLCSALCCGRLILSLRFDFLSESL